MPHTFPYLVDKFFYTAAGATAATANYVNDQTGDGWFKMFEFFEVPSQMIGAIGPVHAGDQFRLDAPGYQAGAHQSEPDHRRGGLLQRLR